MSPTLSTALSLALALAAPATAFWRMPCPGRLVLERIDPIISPGAVSGHVHTVAGGSGFDFNTSYAQQRGSACSSCPIKADLSAYWSPKLYWRNKDNTQFRDVPQAGEYGGNTGGPTVYYQQRYSNNTKKVLAFPPGFRMIAGSPFARNFNDIPAAPGQAVSFVCLDYKGQSTQSNSIPNKKCPNGLRAQVYFPSCWDGVNNDSPTHTTHVAYPIKGSYDNGQCPSTHPARLISIFYEFIFATDQFDKMWWSDTQHPFVFAMGDTTGYGFHGDFLNGWDVDVLQKAADTCTSNSGLISDCPVFTNQLYTNAECQACRLPPRVDEAVTGNLTALPGCNPVSSGPADAIPVATCAVNATLGAAKSFFTDLTATGWSYLGCASDNYYSRTFRGASKTSSNMTVEACTAFCKSKGFALAGTEYASECYCDNTFAAGVAQPNPNILGACGMPCSGNAGEVCGGSGALSVYKACSGATCSNALFGSLTNGVGSVVNGVLGAGAGTSSSSAGGAGKSAATAANVKVAATSGRNSTARGLKRRHRHHGKKRHH